MRRRGPKRYMIDLRISKFDAMTLVRALNIAKGHMMATTGKSDPELAIKAMEASDYDQMTRKILSALVSLEPINTLSSEPNQLPVQDN